MSTHRSTTEAVRVAVRNIGGIDETTVTLDEGVTVLAGRNATNRTSFLQAMIAALGSDDASLKGDTDEGAVELTVGDETYRRTLTRQDGEVHFDGDPYLEDSETADLFAFLLERNDAREAVRRGGDLRDIIMRPVDTESIHAEIETHREQKRLLDERLAELTELREELPALERERSTLESEIEESESALREKEAAIEEMETSVEEAAQEDDELDEALSDLGDVRSELESVRYNIDSVTRSVEALIEEREELCEQRDSLDPVEENAGERIETKLAERRQEREQVQSTVAELQSVIQYNEEMLSGTGNEVAAALRDDADDDHHPTHELTTEETVVCWTCGTDVDRDEITDTLETLRSLREAKRERASEIAEQIDTLEAERAAVEERVEEHQQLERELERVEQELDRRKERRTELQAQRETLEDRVEKRERDVEELEREGRDELLERHREANKLEFELGQLEEELASVNEDIAEIESTLDDEPDIEADRDRVSEELAELRTRIVRTETDAVERFNDHMETVLDVLGYDNLERIWIERLATDDGPEGTFELHVVRTTADGRAYEDVLEHLSESEREVTGLVFALAGYLVHEVYESMPFLLLDSLEAIDADRIASLVDYMATYTNYPVVALLPEDEQALDTAYERVRDI